jgi:serine/arginine repetitive matrix protein 2
MNSHRQYARSDTYVEWVIGSTFFDVWRVLGPIALRAMRSMQSLARMGSWAQFSGAMEEDGRGTKADGTAKGKAKKKNDGTVWKKEGKEKKTKKKKIEDPESRGDDAKKSKSKKSSKSKSSKLKDSVQAPQASTPRLSTSSFEVGALSASPGPMAARTLGESTSSYSSAGAGSGAYLGVGGVAQKKRSILGLGLPPTIRLATVRSGSTASSVLVGGANTVGPSFGAAPTSAATAAAFSVSGNTNNNATNDNRLSVDTALNNPATSPRPSSVLSNASSADSSLRPISTTSTDSRLSRTSSVGSSVRWDEEG